MAEDEHSVAEKDSRLRRGEREVGVIRAVDPKNHDTFCQEFGLSESSIEQPMVVTDRDLSECVVAGRVQEAQIAWVIRIRSATLSSRMSESEIRLMECGPRCARAETTVS